ncbi:MAG: AtpZ/AtpI family protein [Terracidiphilus sp.]
MPYNRPIAKQEKRGKAAGALSSLVEAEKMMQIAIMLPSAAFIGWLVGSFADRHLHQSWIGLTGIIFGGFSGLFYVVRLVLTTKSKNDGEGQGKSGDA